MSAFWNEKRIARAKKILSRYARDEFGAALEAIGDAFGIEVSDAALRGAFQRAGEERPPTSYCRQSSTSTDETQQPASFERLVALTRKGPVPFESLCDTLDMSPRKVRELIEQAKIDGYVVRLENGHVGLKSDEPDSRVRTVGIAPVVGQRQRVAVISDTHLGSKYCLREQLKEFVHYAYQQGVREILHVGDVLDGQYRHGIYEVSHVGLDDQAQDLFETLPRLPGLNYRGITGNHDHTFTESAGVDVGHYLTDYFKRRGRSDLHFYGNRGAFIRVAGAVVHLWHPRSGTSYARSYQLQKHIEKYSSGEKPNILLAGHWHVHCTVYERGVHAIACPTFQGGGSAFSKSLGGAPAIGGLLLSWDVTEHGTLRSFVHEYRAYFEVEKPQQIDNDHGYLEEWPIEARRA